MVMMMMMMMVVVVVLAVVVITMIAMIMKLLQTPITKSDYDTSTLFIHPGTLIPIMHGWCSCDINKTFDPPYI